MANLCCAAEEVIIHTVLDSMNGVEHTSVNVIGRYCIVKHCPVECCAPTQSMVDALNDKFLGATVQEAGQEEDEEESGMSREQLTRYLFVFLLWALFAGKSNLIPLYCLAPSSCGLLLH